jgi:integrase
MSALQLAVIRPAVPPPVVRRDLAEVAAMAQERVREYAEASISDNTREAYRYDWEHFCWWCTELGISPLPATVDTVLAYLSELPTMAQSDTQGRGQRKAPKAGYSVNSIVRRLATISREHKQRGLPSPTADDRVKRLLRGIRRSVGTAPRQKAAMLTEHFRPLRRDCTTVREIRDKALLLVGFAGAFRRCELVGLNLGDCQFEDRLVTIHLRKSKTDQEARGRRVVIHQGGSLCPMAALKAWIAAAGIADAQEPLFRRVGKGGRINQKRLTTEGIAVIVKRYAEARGLNPADYAGHSLRSGHVTTAILRGEAAHAIMAVTGHQSRAMVDRYFRDVEPKRHNSSANLGL